jgi:predicted dehydrogenase
MTFRWGIAGTGPVSRKFALDLRMLPGATVTGVASGQRRNAERFASDLGVPGVASTIDELAASPDVDAVYIATPPAMHRAHAIACMEAGKPVLLEKPFATSSADAEAIAETARKRGVFCMEGMWTRFLPLMTDLRARLAAGEIGEIHAFSGSFSSPNAPDPEQSLFDPDAGGGALAHRGVYPLSIACHLLGLPVAQRSLATLGGTGVDEDGALILRHRNGAISTISSSLRAAAGNDFLISGGEGTIHVQAPIYRPFRMTITRVPVQKGPARSGDLRKEAFKEGSLMQGAHQRLSWLTGVLKGRRARGILKAYAGNGYHYEAAEAMARIRDGALESPLMPLSESVAIAGIIERARDGWSVGA